MPFQRFAGPWMMGVAARYALVSPIGKRAIA